MQTPSPPPSLCRTHPEVGTHVEDLVFARAAQLRVEPEIAHAALDHRVDLLAAARRQLVAVLLQALLGARIAGLDLLTELQGGGGRQVA